MEITLPHKFSPRTYQLPLLSALDSGINRAIIVWHRRSGKDKTCFNYMVKRAVERVGTYFYLLPSYTQAKKVIWDNIDNDGMRMLDHIPVHLIKHTNATELKIELINGSIIQLIAADEFKQSGVGTNPIGVVFSEYSISSKDAWDYIRPILAANKGWAVFNFTPRGKNHAWELLEKAKNDPAWFTETLTVDDTTVLDAETLAQERRESPQAIFEQEYYCKFIDGAGQFFRRIRENVYQGEPGIDPEHSFQLGVDLAKYQDWTVLTPFDLNTFVVHPQERFNNVDWNMQEARIEAVSYRYNQARLKVDATGVGDPIVEQLRAMGLNLTEEDGIKFTEVVRTNLLTHLAMLIEQDKIKLPPDEGLMSELDAFQWRLVVNQQTGKSRLAITVPEGFHDDRVMSLALAVHGATAPLGTYQHSRIEREQEGLYAENFH